MGSTGQIFRDLGSLLAFGSSCCCETSDQYTSSYAGVLKQINDACPIPEDDQCAWIVESAIEALCKRIMQHTRESVAQTAKGERDHSEYDIFWPNFIPIITKHGDQLSKLILDGIPMKALQVLGTASKTSYRLDLPSVDDRCQHRIIGQS